MYALHIFEKQINSFTKYLLWLKIGRRFDFEVVKSLKRLIVFIKELPKKKQEIFLMFDLDKK